MSRTVKYDLSGQAARKKIVLQATTAQINKVKLLIGLDDSQVGIVGQDLYSLEIDAIEVDVPEILLDMSVQEFEGSAPVSMIKVKTFNGSEDFYKGSAGKTGYKIVSDEFSDELNHTLYKGFNRIEAELRQLVIENSHRKGGLKIDSRFYKHRNPDHPVSTFQLSDFIEKLLNAPASDGYMKAEWRRSTRQDANEVVRIAKLTRIDEIKPGLSLDELSTLRNQRNRCMHFNVVTVQDYEATAPLINKYLKASASRMMERTFSEFSEAISKHLEQIATPAGWLRGYVEDQLNLTNNWSNLTKKPTE